MEEEEEENGDGGVVEEDEGGRFWRLESLCVGSICANLYDVNNSPYSTIFVNPAVVVGLAAILGVAAFFINSVIASYNIGGTIEGFHDPKFKRIGTGIVSCLIASIVFALIVFVIVGGI